MQTCEIHEQEGAKQTQASMIRLINATFGSVVYCSWTFCAQSATSVAFPPAARPGHLCVGSDGSSWTVQSPGGGKHTQWVSTAASVSTVSSQNSVMRC